MAKRSGVTFVAEAHPDDRLTACEGRVFIVNPSLPLREIKDGVIVVVDLKDIPESQRPRTDTKSLE